MTLLADPPTAPEPPPDDRGEGSRLLPLISTLSIQTKTIGIESLNLNHNQRQFLQVAERQLAETGRIRIIVLKARQVGISTLTEAIAFIMCFLIPRYKVLIVAHENDSSEGLLGMTNLYWDTCFWHDLYSTRHLSTKHIRWNENNSSLKVATAGSKEVGRSKTIHFLHASEYAFWPNPKQTMLSVSQSIPDTPGTAVVIESTAHGVGGDFHSRYYAAMRGESEYIALFFPWHEHPEYLASYIGLPVPDRMEYDAEERSLINRFGSEVMNHDRLQWRRFAIVDKCGGDINQFHQEYPSTVEEAFVSTGHAVLPIDHLRASTDLWQGEKGFIQYDGRRSRFIPASDGVLTVFRPPSSDRQWGQYIIGVDCVLTTRGDYAVMQVLNRHNLEQCAIFRMKLDPATLGERARDLGHYYNDAILVPEKEGYGGGGIVVGKLLGLQYPNLWHGAKIDNTPGSQSGDNWGWSTNLQTKGHAIGLLMKTLIDCSTTSHWAPIIHDVTTYDEMKNYTRYESGEMGPADQEDGFDDCVMAYAIAIAAHHMSPPMIPYGAEMFTDADGRDSSGDEQGVVGNLLDTMGMGEWQTELPWDEDDD